MNEPELSTEALRRPYALLITGTVGAGKTTVADAIGDLWAEASVPNAVIDLDWLRRFWPSPPDDPFNSALTLDNLRAVTGNFRAAGMERLVMAGVIESREERARHQDAVELELIVCRLTIDPAVVRERLIRRHDRSPAELGWYLDRVVELEAVLDAAQVEDLRVDSGSGSPSEVAAAVLKAVEAHKE